MGGTLCKQCLLSHQESDALRSTLDRLCAQFRVNAWAAIHTAIGLESHLHLLGKLGIFSAVLDLYHGRGAFEAVLADEDVETDPDCWCSYTACGQELWQITCQWIWNLRLTLGHAMQGLPMRETEWTPTTENPAHVLVPVLRVTVAGVPDFLAVK